MNLKLLICAIDKVRFGMKLPETLVSEHIEFFQGKLDEATDKFVPFFGFENYSAQEAFNALLNEQKTHFLPFCLYLINFGIGVSRNENFAQNSLKLIAMDKGEIIDPIAAYIYAYCLNRNHDVEIEQSEEIIHKLFMIEFLPALITSADLDLRHNSLNTALKKYKIAMDWGHLTISGRYYKLLGRVTNFPEKILVKLKWVTIPIVGFIRFFIAGNKGENVMYMDFYCVRKGFKESPQLRLYRVPSESSRIHPAKSL